MVYTPSQKILDRYAEVLINYALHEGTGVKKGEVVMLQVPETARPLLTSLHRTVLKAGAQPIVRIIPEGLDRDFFTYANDSQITFFPAALMKAQVDAVDHFVYIIADSDPKELQGINPALMMRKRNAMKQYMDWRDEKEYAGKQGWTLALYGTPAMAKEAKLSEKAYWDQIIKACFLDKKNPVAENRKAMAKLHGVRDRLNKLVINKLHIVAPGTNLWVKLGADRKWIGGTGRNVPSFECFISPDWRGTNGYIQFTEPLYRFGNLITGARLEFKDGLVVKATAKKGEKLLKEMVKQPNANKIGEYSLTDSRISRITKFMADTLFDENVGGRYGNTHLAIGRAYKDSFTGDPKKVSKAQWEAMGYNDSAEHTDIVATSDRTVTAHLLNGKKVVIYRDGKFTV